MHNVAQLPHGCVTTYQGANFLYNVGTMSSVCVTAEDTVISLRDKEFQ